MSVDVVVIGAGHAGIEAAAAVSRLGLRAAVVTTNTQRIGFMSCNPAIGGLAKGHMVREVDVLGGEMGLGADATCIQFKRLNASKGPAVRGSRTQCDKEKYSAYMRGRLAVLPGLSVIESEVKKVVIESGRCTGVVLGDGSVISARGVVITAGTFMNGVMHVGLTQENGGRVGDAASLGLSDQLRSEGFQVRRLKTGTPARLDADSIDWSKTVPQYGDGQFYPFSFRSAKAFQLPQVACYLSHTNERTHDIIRENLHRSPMFCGIIEGVGPRYCPSIEDKITRFPEKTGHQTFLEPESLETNSIYLQGISTSLPADVQQQFLETIPGLGRVKVLRYGYAVEYDFVQPTQLHATLETKAIKGLFLAGQVNGTSGYEEAAGQGLLAGLNAGLRILEKDAIILRRDEAYIGVLIDDLVTKGTEEPYRMFTSRAEHRLVLREDNTLDRLIPRAEELGLLSGSVLESYQGISDRRDALMADLSSRWVVPDEKTQCKMDKIGTSRLTKPQTLEQILRRPEVSFSDMEIFGICGFEPEEFEAVEINIKYAGYIHKQNEIIEQTVKLEGLVLGEDVSYAQIRGLSAEELEKLDRIRPRTLGQAARISGITPSAIQAVLVYLRGRGRNREGGGQIFRRPGPVEGSGVVS